MSFNPALSTQFSGGGQIVRIFLENFMSSNNVEVVPGMHLNLIIGPNGSGKSTLLSAVLLCLDGKLATLNRKNLGDFIMAGKNQCIIEVELRNTAGQNHIVRRVITKNATSGQSSEFWLNGKPTNKKKIGELRSHYNIQIDNLCCFLSQEKVQDFSKMDNAELLENTEQTVGDGHLVGLHYELKDMRKTAVALQNSIENKEKELENQVNKNDRIKGKVQTIKEKQALNDKVVLLNQKKHWLKFDEANRQKAEVEVDMKKAEENSIKYDAEFQAAQKKIQEINKSNTSLKEAWDMAKKEENIKKTVRADRLTRLENQSEDFLKLESHQRAKMDEEADKKARIMQCQTTIEKLNNDLAAVTTASQTAAQDGRKISAQIQEVAAREVSLLREKKEIAEELENIGFELRNVGNKKRRLEGVTDRKIQALQRSHPHIIQAMNWIKNNKHRLRGNALGPLMIHVNIKDPSKVKVVEASIPGQDMHAFVFEFKEDLNLAVREMRENMGIKGISCVAAEDAMLQEFRPPRRIEELRKYGFQAYVGDYIDAPPEIIAYLCQNAAIHRNPVGDSRVNSQCSQVPADIQRFFSDDSVFSIRTSSYSGAKSTTVNPLNEPRYFNETVDYSKIAELDEQLESLNSKAKKFEARNTALCNELESAQSRKDELMKKKRFITQHDTEKSNITRRLESAKSDLTKLKRSLADTTNLEASFSKERKALEAKVNRMVDDLHKAEKNLETATAARMKASLSFFSCRIGLEALEEASRLAKEALTRADQTRSMVAGKLHSLERECSKIKQKAKDLTDGILRSNKAAFKPFEEKFAKISNSLDEIESAINEAQSKADFLPAESADLLIEYNNREREIIELKKEVTDLRSEEAAQLAEMAAKRQTWLEPVREVISRVNETFGNHFETMQCAGEVALFEPEDKNDYDAYGVSIRVKFWDEMPLQELTRNTQSGGERTVATAIYGLSLQNLTTVPFRFVDEINQGMDAHNERNICEMLSSSTSVQDSPQYFYLTPKLMDDFVCPDNMAVLCVYNGPDAISTTEWDVEQFLLRGQSHMADE